jgi:hypothetical protein
MQLPMSILRTLSSAALAAAALGSTACTATVTTTPAHPTVVYDEPVVAVDAPPPGIYERPNVDYRGRPAYLVGDRWYYPAEGGWVYFQREPRELREKRIAGQYSHAEPRETRRRYPEAPTETRRRRYD